MKIVNREQAELTDAERRILSRVRFKKTFFLVVAYIAILAVITLVCLTGWIKSSGTSMEQVERFQRATIGLASVCFVLFTTIFIVYYFKTVHPYTRDLRRGLKTVSWFYPVAYKTPFFDSFFLKTGSKKKPMMPIRKELFDAIRPGVLGCILFAPSSRFVLLLDIDGYRMEFNEENADLEL
jgi:hypothetical protein